MNELRILTDWVTNQITPSDPFILSQEQYEWVKTHLGGRAAEFRQDIESEVRQLCHGRILELDLGRIRFCAVRLEDHVLVGLRLDSAASGRDTIKQHDGSRPPFLSESPRMKQVEDILQKVSFVDSTVLLLGRSGVGKSRIARLIHNASSRSHQNFLSVNCGALPESLMEAELFGYAPGSFTGADRSGKRGIFEAANGGTVFLDEVADLPVSLQVKLLQVLQDRCIRRIGATSPVMIDARVIAATNRDLPLLVRQREFREDLYYRLNVIPIEIPSLCERREEIIPLARLFLNRLSEKYGLQKSFDPLVEAAFESYHWPGNVRELENLVERLFIIHDELVIMWEHLPSNIRTSETGASANPRFGSLREAKRELECQMIIHAYSIYQSTYKVAEVLQVDQSTIVKKMQKYRNRGMPI